MNKVQEILGLIHSRINSLKKDLEIPYQGEEYYSTITSRIMELEDLIEDIGGIL